MVQMFDRLSRFTAKVAFLAAALWYLISKVLVDKVPAFIVNYSISIAISVSFLLLAIDGLFIYPFTRNPLRKLPTVGLHGNSIGKIVMESPRGATPLTWIKQHPGADIIHIRSAFNISQLVPVSPRAFRDVLNTNTYDFEKPWGARAFLARVIGFGLILSEGGAHKRQRKALTPAFHVRKIRDLYGLMWEKTQILLSELENDIAAHPAYPKYGEKDEGKGLVEMAEWGSRLTLDIIGPTAMGKDFQSLTTEDNPIAAAFLEVLEPSRERLAFLGLHFALPEWILRVMPGFGATNEMLNRNEVFLRGLCLKIIEEKKFEVLRQEKGKDYDILSQILATKEFSDSEIVDQMLTFLAAGHETTASALTWCTHLLALHPQIQTSLREEIHTAIPTSTSPITHDLLENLPLLNGVCEETLRLYPTVPTTIREAIRPTTVAGVPIPADTTLLLVPYAINRNPAFWGPDADAFNPSRWIDTLPDGTTRGNKSGGVANPSNFGEITFLHGPRACIGRDFAKAELRCAIAGVVGGFGIEMEKGEEEIKVSGVITTKPVGGMRLMMRRVEGW